MVDRDDEALAEPMIINAISAVTGARATDGGLTVVLKMLDGADQPVRILLPVGAVEQTLAFLTMAKEEAAVLQAAASGRCAKPD